MDGQGYTNVVTPEMKALTALLHARAEHGHPEYCGPGSEMEAYEVQLGRYPVEGGIPIVINHQMIGVVGTGGYPPNPPEWDDGICAQKAMLEVLGPSVPPLPEDVRRQKPPIEALCRSPVLAQHAAEIQPLPGLRSYWRGRGACL